jgi:hypothetical protein
MPTIDARGYIPPGMMTTEYVKQNNTEYWDIVNTTVDAHPMHIHQVAFRSLWRQAITAFDPPYSNAVTKVFTQPTYHTTTPVGMPPNLQIPVDVWDAGWKDTIQVIPGTVVRVIAKWDLAGEYVWHCHILSHEEHDMMRPFMVVTASAVLPPKKLTAAVNNNLGTVTLSWPAVVGATGYVIHESTDAFVTSHYAATTGPVLTAVMKNVPDGSYTYRIAAVIGTAQTAFTSSLTPVVVAKTVAAPGSVTAPLLNDNGLIPVSWKASATPSLMASVTGKLAYPLQYLVTYDVTATLVTAVGTPVVAYTTPGITLLTATIGQTPDPVTGVVLPLPDGIYTVSVVANLASWKPSIAKAALNNTTVSRIALPVTKVNGAKTVGVANTITASWPASKSLNATYTVFQNGVQVATGLKVLTYTTGPLVNGIYIMGVQVDRVAQAGSAPGVVPVVPAITALTSSVIVSDLTPVTINVTNPAPVVTVTKVPIAVVGGTGSVTLTWPTLAGATLAFTQNAAAIAPVITTTTTVPQSSSVTISGLVKGAYTFTIQNTTANGTNPSAIVTKKVTL